MADLSDNKKWKEHLKRHEKITDKPAYPYCTNREIRFDAGKLQSHLQTQHPGKENVLTAFKYVDRTNQGSAQNSNSEYHHLPCIFHLKMGRNVSFPDREAEAWHSHNISRI